MGGSQFAPTWSSVPLAAACGKLGMMAEGPGLPTYTTGKFCVGFMWIIWERSAWQLWRLRHCCVLSIFSLKQVLKEENYFP